MQREVLAPEPTLAGWAWPQRGAVGADKAAAIAQDHVLDLVARALDNAKLEALLAKGAGLRHLYPSPWLRPMADIDLLVRPRELNDVALALEGAGFLRQQSDRPLTEAVLEIGLCAPTSVSALVELHGSMDKVIQRPIDPDAVFRRSSASKWSRLRIPSLEDQLLLVALHLASDEFRHATGFVDLEVLIAAGANLDLAASRGVEWEARNALYLTLTTLAYLLEDARAPARVAAKLTPGWARCRLLSTHFRIAGWPVAKHPTELGPKWLYGQALLHDHPSAFIGQLSIYAVKRLLERTQSRWPVHR